MTVADGMRALLDTSALTKRYTDEAGRDQVLAIFQASRNLVIAAHCKAEMASALLQRRREGSLSASDFDRTWHQAQQDVADMESVPLDAHVERLAFAAMERHPLRASEALHIGSALVARVDLFVTADARQAQAAHTMGLPTEWVRGDQKETT
ncbi:type II toxin-antitoxin system VapC family toxin [Xylophilus ampelinus]|uniref:type II toxin-antitoxin system VapC family toxin n=1 Tax=Xylophilus ampelinus TaxID=54067 RepID=UPI0011B84D3D|nr:type II toxin-antitoxin system VapC family toxin [Xylophilus ampelinus]